MNNKKTLLLIGAGPTSSLISYAISTNSFLKNSIEIHVWEKARGIGGRFSTSRSPKNHECYLDLGAQYLSKSLDHPTSKLYFDNLKNHNLLRPLQVAGIPGFRSRPGQEHYACKEGSASIVKHFFDQAAIRKNDILFNCRVVKIKPLESGKVEVIAENEKKSTFDIVISTIPVPQILQLENYVEFIPDDIRHKLENVKYSTRFALGLFFDQTKITSSTQPFTFVENDPVFRYWSIENLKRTGTFDEPTSVVMHTSIQFGAINAEEDKENLKEQLLQKASKILPEVADLPHESAKSHKWRFSQVLEPFEGRPGFIKLNEQVFAAGDGFTGSGLEGCIDSAEKAVSALKETLSQ